MNTDFLVSIHICCSKCLEEIRKILDLTIEGFAFEINYSTSGYRRLVGLDHGFKIDSAIKFDILKIINSIFTNFNDKLLWKEHKKKIVETMTKYAKFLIS